MKNTDKGFTLIEVLISMVILTATIITLNISYKFYISRLNTLHKYENLYSTVLSIKDYISTEKLYNNQKLEGKINNVNYNAEVTLVDKKNNIVFNEEQMKFINNGFLKVYLYKINLKVKNKNFEFYVTK